MNVKFSKVLQYIYISGTVLHSQMVGFMNPQLNSLSGEAEMVGLRESIQQLLRSCWRYNKNLEEQAAQLHMLTGWSQIVEVNAFVHG